MKLSSVAGLTTIAGFGMLSLPALAEDAPQFDASDPTKIYSFLGGGPKYVDYTNGEHMWEFRLIGNLPLGPRDMVLIESGYGTHSGDSEPGDSSGWTNTRARWFHVFDMNYDLGGSLGADRSGLFEKSGLGGGLSLSCFMTTSIDLSS